jgi:hypothetical protein
VQHALIQTAGEEGQVVVRRLRQERRIFLEAIIVSVLGHAIFFSVFVVKERLALGDRQLLPAAVAVAPFEGLDPAGTRSTDDPSETDPRRLADVELERRTTAPTLELDRASLVWEDEPELGTPPPPRVGPETWDFGKEPARLRDELPPDYDAGPARREAGALLAGGTGEGQVLRVPFSVPFRKAPGAGALMLGPDEAGDEGVRLFSGEIRLDLGRWKFDFSVRPTGDPLIDKAMMKAMARWEITVRKTAEGYKLDARLPFPRAIRGLGSKHMPLSADEAYGDEG